jgi:hypothetical protein
MIGSVPVRLAAALLVPLALAAAQAGEKKEGDKPKEGEKKEVDKKEGDKKEGDKGAAFSAKGEIVLPAHKVKMEKDQLYTIEVQATGFTPRVLIPGVFLPYGPPVIGPAEPPPGTIIAPFPKKGGFHTTFIPIATKEYDVIVFPEIFGGPLPKGKLEYTLNVKAVPLGSTPLLKVSDKLTDQDMKYGPNQTYSKAYPVKMKAGQTYIIDLVRPGNDFKLDPYLFLEDAGKKIVAQDDDSGGNLNARIVFTPKQDGEHRIIATTLAPATGDFTLTVRGPTADGGKPEDKK